MNSGYLGTDQRTARAGVVTVDKLYLERRNDRMVSLPSDVSGLVCWQNPRMLEGWLSDTGSVDVWPDASGNSRGIGSGAGVYPSYRTGVVNGRPVVRFDGTNDRMTMTWPSAVSPPYTLFVVAQFAGAWASGQQAIVDSVTDVKATLFRAINNTSMYFTNGSQIGPATVTTTDWAIYRVIVNGASSSLRANNGTPATGTCAAQSLDGMTLGSRGGSVDYAACDLGDVLVYSGALSTGDCAIVEGYLAAKYGITLS